MGLLRPRIENGQQKTTKGSAVLGTDGANVTLHHEMSRNAPDGHFHVITFSESKIYVIYNGENHFQIRGLVAELHVFEYSGTTFGTFENTRFKY